MQSAVPALNLLHTAASHRCVIPVRHAVLNLDSSNRMRAHLATAGRMLKAATASLFEAQDLLCGCAAERAASDHRHRYPDKMR